MILTLDIGNTRCKLTTFSRGDIVAHCALSMEECLVYLRQQMQQAEVPRALAFCNVGKVASPLTDYLQTLDIPLCELTALAPPQGVSIAYRTPHSLGADRLAAVLGARELCPHCNLLVVDVGTCVTIDLFTTDGVFHGGNISPGVALRLKAMYQHTSRLPWVDERGDIPSLGYDTETALRSGALRGLAYEIEGYAQYWYATYPDLQVYLTGGGAVLLPFSQVPNLSLPPFCYDAHLVARGLVSLLR